MMNLHIDGLDRLSVSYATLSQLSDDEIWGIIEPAAQTLKAKMQEVIVRMAERGVACNVHYKPLPMMTAYKALGFSIADFPNAYHLFENEVTLPLHTRLSDEDVEYVIECFAEVLRG